MTAPLQPTLVMPVYRGGQKFARALTSVRPAEQYFHRIVVSLNSAPGSPDETTVANFLSQGPSKIEVIQSGRELAWMDHQYFWLAHLEATGARSTDWITWFAHDDQIRARGIEALVDSELNWPLIPRTTYLGPWGVRLDPPDSLFSAPPGTPVESWTSFPIDGPPRLTVSEWIAQQLEQPTYINMSGCVTQLASFQQMRAFPYRKPGGMRIEMATAAAPHNEYVREFPEPIVITYTSVTSDRTTYDRVARKDDAHLAAWWGNYLLHHPTGVLSGARCAVSIASRSIGRKLGRSIPVTEDWRQRTTVEE